MGRWFEHEGGQIHGLIVILTIVTITRITVSDDSFDLQRDGVNYTNITASDLRTVPIPVPYRPESHQLTKNGNMKLGDDCQISEECSDLNAVCEYQMNKEKDVCNCAKDYQIIKHEDINVSSCVLITGVKELGEECSRTSQCLVRYAVCDKSVCRCSDYYRHVKKNNVSFCEFKAGDKELGEECSQPSQCSDRYAVCDESVCRCRDKYQHVKNNNVSYCAFKTANVPVYKSQEIYKVAMVALACFILAVLALFLLFIVNRSIKSRRLNGGERSGSNSREDDIFSVCDQLALDRLRDKPPTYEDVALSDQQILGMPPPVYDEESLSAAIATRRFLLSNPASGPPQEEPPFSNAASASGQSPSSSTARTLGQAPLSNSANATEPSPSPNAASARATGQSSSSNEVIPTAGHDNEAFVSDA